MACFLATTVEAIATTAAMKAVNSKKTDSDITDVTEASHTPSLKRHFVKRLNWLSNMLWGGSTLLAFEHIWHGELTPFFPFLTAAGNPEDAAAMLQEIGTVGVGMAVIVTAVWAAMVIVSHSFEKKVIADAELTHQEV